MTRVFALASVAAASIALAGCKLIDQNTFKPEPDPVKPAAIVAPGIKFDQRVPLLTIRYDVPHPDYASTLAIATHAVDLRRPGVEYDVITVIPSAADAAQGEKDAAAVGEAMVEQGTAPSRIHIGARIDPTLKDREVRLYLR